MLFATFFSSLLSSSFPLLLSPSLCSSLFMCTELDALLKLPSKTYCRTHACGPLTFGQNTIKLRLPVRLYTTALNIAQFAECSIITASHHRCQWFPGLIPNPVVYLLLVAAMALCMPFPCWVECRLRMPLGCHSRPEFTVPPARLELAVRRRVTWTS